MAAFACALPRGQGRLRLGAALYLLACVVFLLVHTPMGSNIERYGVLLAGPLLLCASARRARARRRAAGAARAAAVRSRCARGPCGPAGARCARRSPWPAASRPAPPTTRRSSAFSTRTRGRPLRLEVPLTRTHWETAELAPRVSLARGWEKQLDTRYDAVLLRRRPRRAGYERWLHAQAVSYVALPDAELDPSSAREGQLIRAGLPYLHEVLASRHWRIYAVIAPTPLASGPGRLTSLGHESFALAANSARQLSGATCASRATGPSRAATAASAAPTAAGRVCVRAPPARWSCARASRWAVRSASQARVARLSQA